MIIAYQVSTKNARKPPWVYPANDSREPEFFYALTAQNIDERSKNTFVSRVGDAIAVSHGQYGRTVNAEKSGTVPRLFNASGDTAVTPFTLPYTAVSLFDTFASATPSAFDGVFNQRVVSNFFGLGYFNTKYVYYDNAGDRWAFADGPAYHQNEALVLGAVRYRSTTTADIIVIDSGGLRSGTDTLGSNGSISIFAGTTASNTAFQIGQDAGASVRRWDGGIYDFRMYDRDVGDGELMSIFLDPWKLYGEQRSNFFIPEAAAGSTFQAAWAARSTVTVGAGVS